MSRETITKTVLGGLVAALMSVFGAWSQAMQALVVLMVLDVVTGFTRAGVQGELSSKESWRGILKKVTIPAVIALAYQVDTVVGTHTLFRDALVAFYCASEGLSILENAGEAGVPFPGWLTASLQSLRDRKPETPQEEEAQRPVQ